MSVIIDSDFLIMFTHEKIVVVGHELLSTMVSV